MVVPLKRQRGGNFQNLWSDPDEMNIDEVLHFCNEMLMSQFKYFFTVLTKSFTVFAEHMLVQHKVDVVSVVVNVAHVMCLSCFLVSQATEGD